MSNNFWFDILIWSAPTLPEYGLVIFPGIQISYHSDYTGVASGLSSGQSHFTYHLSSAGEVTLLSTCLCHSPIKSPESCTAYPTKCSNLLTMHVCVSLWVHSATCWKKLCLMCKSIHFIHHIGILILRPNVELTKFRQTENHWLRIKQAPDWRPVKLSSQSSSETLLFILDKLYAIFKW